MIINERYCPQCNRETEVVLSHEDPFVVHSCSNCGHVHKIVDAPGPPSMEPVQAPFWRWQR
jgi:uncharacterized Zn finger protein